MGTQTRDRDGKIQKPKERGREGGGERKRRGESKTSGEIEIETEIYRKREGGVEKERGRLGGRQI